MIDYTQIARLIVEEIANDPGICFYPAGFKPPHKGHFKAAQALAARQYVREVRVIISKKVEEGISPEQSLEIWNKYLEAAPNSKIKPRLANSNESPVEDVFAYVEELEKKKKQSSNKKPTTTEEEPQEDKTVYVAGGDDEKDDQSYMESLSTKYPNTVKTISIHEKDGKVTSYYVRELLRKGDYESFKKTIPEAAFNKGYAKPIFQSLVKTIQETPPTEDGSEETATA